MALRKPNPAFEDTANLDQEQVQEQGTETVMNTDTQAANDTATEARTEAAAPAPAPAAAQLPAVQVSTAVSTMSRDEIARQAKAFQAELNDMKGAADFTFGNYPVFKGNNGEIAQTGKDDVSLGRWAKVRLLAWDDHHEISPGSQDKNSKDFVAYSKEGRIVDHVIGEELKSWVGKSVDEYVEYLRTTEGFDKASSKRFVDLSAALLGTDSGDGPVGTVIQITLSPSSIPSFTKYQQALKDQARCAAMGLPGFSVPEDPFSFFVIREVVSANNNRWTKLNFAAQLPAKI